MKTRLAHYRDLHDTDALELLSILLVIWCRKNNRDPDELLPKCHIALQRFRNGECDEDRLFGNL